MPPTSTLFRKVLDALTRDGILLEADAVLPCVVTLAAGEPVRGSWWGHPKGHDIFAACKYLMDHPEALSVKLVSGKVTYVHRELWPSLVSVVTSGQDWQTEGLSGAAKAIHAKVEKDGTARSDDLKRAARGDKKKVATGIRELEERLLVHSAILHTDGGNHVKVIESWEYWLEKVRGEGGIGGRPRVGKAKGNFEVLVDSLNERFGADASLPW